MKAKIVYSLLALIGAGGLVVTLLYVINGNDYFLLWILAILSMLLMLIGILAIAGEGRAK